MTRFDETFDCMGGTARVLIEDRDAQRLGPAAVAYLTGFDTRLSRFREDSELTALNRDPREDVPASALLRAFAGAALWAAERSGGLVDPTLVAELDAAGYESWRAGSPRVTLRDALQSAPRRRPARPAARARWRTVRVRKSSISRPPGLLLDSGGVGKGLAADAVAHQLARADRFVVDCGGDVRVGGAERAPRDVLVEHPLTRENTRMIEVSGGAVATSAISNRLWRDERKLPAHHLLDPSTGRPAWTGLVGASAVAPTALEAETLAKMALLTGPDGGRTALGPTGGLLFHDDGAVEEVGAALAAAP